MSVGHTSKTAEFTGSAAQGDLDFSDPALSEAIKAVNDDSNETTWALFGYVGGQNKLKVVETGTGGLDDLGDEMDDSKVLYGYCKVSHGALTKYVYIAWAGEGVPAVRKAMIGSHAPIVADRLIKHFHVQINARNSDDMDAATILAKVKKAGGADYDAGDDKGLKHR